MSAGQDRDLFEPGADSTTLLVAADPGILTVRVAGDRVGSYGLDRRCHARAVATHEGSVAVATDDDVLLAADDAFENTGFGAAATVGTANGFVAASPEDTIAAYDDGTWDPRGTVPDVRMIRDGFIAAAAGVHRLDADRSHVGLDDVHTVIGTPVPRAGTATGVYRLANGWVAEHEGATTVLATDETGDRVHAVIEDSLHKCRDGTWTPIAVPETSPIVDITYGEGVYAITRDGTLLASGGGDWRTHELGVGGVQGMVTTRE